MVLPPPAAEAIARVPPRIDVPWLFYTKTGLQFNKGNLFYWWNPVRKAFGKPDLDFYDLRHYGGSYMTNVLELPSEVTAIQMGHRGHGRLVRELYGHKDEARAREELGSATASDPALAPSPAAATRPPGGMIHRRGNSFGVSLYDPTQKGMRWSEPIPARLTPRPPRRTRGCTPPGEAEPVEAHLSSEGRSLVRPGQRIPTRSRWAVPYRPSWRTLQRRRRQRG